MVLSCLSATLVYCGQTVGWIRMPLGTEVGLGPGIVLDGDPAAPWKGAQQSPHFRGLWQQAWVRIKCGPCLLWPNGWIDQDATWYNGRSRPRRHCVRWGPQFPPPFLAHFALAWSPISATAELLCDSVSDLYRRVIFPYCKFIASKL